MAATQDFHRKTQEEISMTREEFQKLTQDVVLLDGATGSNLMAAGMPRGICTEAWIMEHKEVLQNLQKAYVEAGSQIVYAPTFGGNRYSLGLHGLQDKLAEMNHALVNISREAASSLIYSVSSLGFFCVTRTYFLNLSWMTGVLKELLLISG